MWQHIVAWFAWLFVTITKRPEQECQDCDGETLCEECRWWWSIK